VTVVGFVIYFGYGSSTASFVETHHGVFPAQAGMTMRYASMNAGLC